MSDTRMRIGFVDYDLNNFHANVFLKIAREDLKHRGFVVTGATAMRKPQGRAWCAEKDVPWFDSVDQLDGEVDAYMILAPGRPDTHLRLSEAVLPKKKPTYVDKTFAPDLKTAQRIFELADRNRVAMQTASALRYTPVQAFAAEVGRKNIRHMIAWAPGRSFGEYAIHAVEMVVSCMGTGATELMRRGTGKQSQLLVNFTGGRTAVINVYVKSGLPYAGMITAGDKTRYMPVDTSRLFVDALGAIMDFLEAGKPNIDRRESLMIRRILDAAGDPRALKKFIKL